MQIYVMLKRLIQKGNYDKEDMINKLDTYYLMGRLTDDEYMELMDMVCPPAVEEPPMEDIPAIPEDPSNGADFVEDNMQVEDDEIPGEEDAIGTLPAFPDEEPTIIPEL